ncbi:hypothetical protein [Anaeromicrobium sediminis]|uniref:Zinc-ribbon domain-containing protein n=1 Tax=Anaeromicrobium sediminis TaxID=1478221 RepID=A0A267MGA8_9FIRM|nr:hypothetical protein [Anaeromicrobium sediminis]PAB58609.1 hypothetical protein CCE28_14085 [Anaeromicrobium sediminis]
MKKIMAGILILVLLLLMFFQNNKHHFIYGGSTCGTGVDGLKLLGIYMAIALLVLTILWINKRKRAHESCCFCKAKLEEKWKTCPYCGSELERDGKKP